jgi:hypothetical protein
MKRIACNQPRVAAARAQVEYWIKDRAKDALRFRNDEMPEDRNRKLNGRLRRSICCRVHRSRDSCRG